MPPTASVTSGRQDGEAGSGRLVRWLPWMFGALALAVYLLWYWNPVYRFDEYLVAVTRTRLSWQNLLAVIARSDPGPGPLYILMKPWTALSSDPWWTRLPSVIAMALGVGGLVAFTKASVDARTAAFAGLLMVVLPVTSRWAQDNRMYAPAAACAVFAVLFWWRSVTGGSRRWSVGYGAAVLAMGLLHLYALTLIPALLLAALWVPGSRRATLLQTLVPPAVAVIALLPHIYLNAGHPTGSPTNPAVSLSSVAAMANVGALCGGEVDCRDIPLAAGVTLMTALLAVGGCAWAWRFRERRVVVALGVGWVLVPLLCFVGARAVLGMPTLVSRYIFFAIPGACILAALGLDALYRHWRPGAAIALGVIIALSVPQQISVRSPGSHSADVYRLGLLLRQPGLAGLPVVAGTRELKLTVDAATYPKRVIAPATAAPGPVAVAVVAGSALSATTRSPYLKPGSPWRPVVRCRLGASGFLEVVATPGASVPSGTPGDLARQLNVAVPGSRCVAPP